MPKFRKKPVVVEAIQWNGRNADEVVRWAQGDWEKPLPLAPAGSSIWIKQKVIDPNVHPVECLWFLVIPTLEGDHEASVDDWIIKGTKGEFYPCKPDIFADIYEPA